MATRSPTAPVTLIAAADLSTKQHTFGKLSADRTINAASVSGERVHGVILGKPTAAGQPCDVALLSQGPMLPITLNATLSAGARIMTDATGKAIAATATNYCVGELIEGGVAGDVVMFMPGTIQL